MSELLDLYYIDVILSWSILAGYCTTFLEFQNKHDIFAYIPLQGYSFALSGITGTAFDLHLNTYLLDLCLSFYFKWTLIKIPPILDNKHKNKHAKGFGDFRGRKLDRKDFVWLLLWLFSFFSGRFFIL